MKHIWILCLVSLLIVANKCKSKEDIQAAILQKTWLHSHEEDEGEIRAYRPNSYDFPPSRGRTGFTFEPNGVFKQYDIAPTDGLEENTGKWEMTKKDHVKITFDNKEKLDYEIEIKSIKDDLLKIKRIYPTI